MPLRGGNDAEINLIASDSEDSELLQLDFEDDTTGGFKAGALLPPALVGGGEGPAEGLRNTDGRAGGRRRFTGSIQAAHLIYV